jgi:hypothetical protein
MAKFTANEIQNIDFKLQSVLPKHHILDYDMVTFKNGRGRYAPKSELLVVRSVSYDNPMGGNTKVQYNTFYVKRETLCNEIESLIKQ